MIDKEIIINKDELPKLIRNCIETLEYYDEIKDEEMYDGALEALDTTAKSYAIENKLSVKTYETLMRKYGGEL